MQVTIRDDFNLKKIAGSGQCFRCKVFSDETYRFIAGKNVLYIRQIGDADYEASCDESEWNNVWIPYFDLKRDYHAIREGAELDPFMAAASEFGRGIRILRQDPWETFITFILTQQKSIPATRACVEKLSETYGERLLTDEEELYTFPSPQGLCKADDKTLKDYKLGYRAKYVLGAARRIAADPEILCRWDDLNDDALFNALNEFNGVGKKIANCTMLFAYGRLARAPIDTWIEKIIDKKYGGVNPFPRYGNVAGLFQQYAFFYAQQHKEEF